MSNVTKPIVLNETLENTNKLIGALVRDRVHSGSYTLAEIREIVASGIASQVFSLGDQVVTTYTDTDGTQYTMPWDIVDFRNVTLQDGESVPGMIIQSHYATVETVQFDAPEPDNLRGTGGVQDTSIASQGYNRWSECGLRAWLNSASTKKTDSTGGWFGTTFERNGSSVARQSYDVAPGQETQYNGFMHGLPTAFLNIIKPIQVTTKCNNVTDSGVTDTTYDKFWLPSNTELYTQELYTEGTVFPYWKRRLGRTTVLPLYTAWDANITHRLEYNGTATNVYTRRSCNLSGSHNIFYTSTTGYVDTTGCHLSYRNVPCCAIC